MKKHYVLEKASSSIPYDEYLQLDLTNAGAIIYVDDFTNAYRFHSPIDAEMFLSVRELNIEHYNLYEVIPVAFKVKFEKTLFSRKN